MEACRPHAVLTAYARQQLATLDAPGTDHRVSRCLRRTFLGEFVALTGCSFEHRNARSALSVRLSDRITLPVPTDRTDGYRPHVGQPLLFGLRPEQRTDVRPSSNGAQTAEFAATPDVVEPMAVETLVYFSTDGKETCARLDSVSGPEVDKSITLAADLAHMHLIDASTDRVL